MILQTATNRDLLTEKLHQDLAALFESTEEQFPADSYSTDASVAAPPIPDQELLVEFEIKKEARRQTIVNQFHHLVTSIFVSDCKYDSIPLPFLILEAVKRHKDELAKHRDELTGINKFLAVLSRAKRERVRELRKRLKDANNFFEQELFEAKELFFLMYKQRPNLLCERNQDGEELGVAADRLAEEFQNEQVQRLAIYVKHLAQTVIHEAPLKRQRQNELMGKDSSVLWINALCSF